MEFEFPQTRAPGTSDGVTLAYSVSGRVASGDSPPLDVVFVPANYSHIELFWENENTSQWIRRVASYARVIFFNKRGTGLSDPVRGRSVPTPEEWMDDLVTVLDTVGSTRTALVALDEGGPVALLFAAIKPERASALVLINSFARLTRAPDYPWGLPPGPQEAMLRVIGESWGTGLFADVTACKAGALAS